MTSNSSSCPPARQAVSNGALQGDNPLHFALPLLVIQITLVLIVTRSLAFLFKPIRQPRVLAEIIGGVLLGPSALGRNSAYMNAVFPKQSLTILDTVSTLGLLFFLFMVGLELDLYEIRKSGKIALLIALTGIAVPFVAGIGVASLLHQSISAGVKFAPLAVFIGVPLSVTAFPVLVRIMAERKLLTTELGLLVVPSAAINDMCAWIMLGVGVATAGPSSSPETPVYVMMCGLAFVIFMLVIGRKFMEWIALRASCDQTVSEVYVCITLAGVLVAGFATDAIGIHPLFGAFFFGLIVPKEGTFAQMLIEKIEDFVTNLMLPLFFASSGLKTNLGTINSAKSVGFLVLLVLTAGVGKISATVIVALSLGMQLRTAFAFGFLMNTKGLAELIILNIGQELGILNDQTFAILILTCLVSIFMTTPAVVALYKPARNPVPYTNRKLEGTANRKDELRILACVQGTKNVPALLNLVEACRGERKRSLKLYAMNLVELSDRPSAIMTLSRARKDSLQPSPSEDQIFLSFETYRQLTKVPVRLLSATSELADMHEDVCNTAAMKRATIIVLPFNFYQREDGTIEYINSGFRTVSQKVLHHAPCSVSVLMDRGLWGSAQLSESSAPHKVAVFFFGGADDREALAFGCRLAEHSNLKLWVLRFLPPDDQDSCVIRVSQSESLPTLSRSSTSALADDGVHGTDHAQQDEASLDDESLAAVKEFTGGDMQEDNSLRSIFFEEHTLHRNPGETVLSIAKASDFLLLLVGRRSCSSVSLSSPADNHSEHSELGLIGDALAFAGPEVKASILVIQQHDANLATSTFLPRESTPAYGQAVGRDDSP